ncbi:MAG: PKD domain-containing protein, partial [Parachlamydiaceae bacterium]|nr:PKD domain-containing protein [Parachlamydiaceae bacterium]
GTALYGGVNIHEDLIQNPGTLVAGIANAFVTFETRMTPFDTLVRFNGSKFGRLGVFCWDFGDATGICHTSPVISHRYARPGTYVVKLTTIIRGLPFTTSRTIQVAPTAVPNACVLVCPPRHVQLKRSLTAHRHVMNVIKWKGAKANNLCENPAYYLVFRDESLTKLVAKVSDPDKNGTYKAFDKTKLKAKTAYTVVAVDVNGNFSIPVTVRSVRGTNKPCGCGN